MEKFLLNGMALASIGSFRVISLIILHYYATSGHSDTFSFKFKSTVQPHCPGRCSHAPTMVITLALLFHDIS